MDEESDLQLQRVRKFLHKLVLLLHVVVILVTERLSDAAVQFHRELVSGVHLVEDCKLLSELPLGLLFGGQNLLNEGNSTCKSNLAQNHDKQGKDLLYHVSSTDVSIAHSSHRCDGVVEAGQVEPIIGQLFEFTCCDPG